jgi:hypothetical protein
MKKLLYVVFFCLPVKTFSQFAIIQAKDDIAYFRKQAKANSDILDTLYNGQIVLCPFKTTGYWLVGGYYKNDEYDRFRRGYVHKSRVTFINEFDTVTLKRKKDNTIVFQNDSISVALTTTDFQKDKCVFEWDKDDTTLLRKINGKMPWGNDGKIPKTRYKSIAIECNGKKVNIPETEIDNLYEPNIDTTKVTYDSSNKKLYIYTSNGEKSGAYQVLWVIENGNYARRVVDYPF